MEIWKDIPGFEGIYQASTFGRIKSLPRVVIDKNGVKYSRKGQILKPSKCTGGYLRVDLKHKKSMKVHRIIASTFIPKVKCKNLVNHIDGNKINSRVSNLEWCNASENNKHAFAIGLNKRSKKAGRKNIPVYQMKNGVIINEFSSFSEAGRKTNTPRENIAKTVRGERNTANGWEWKVIS